jgi:hypothetical protein
MTPKRPLYAHTVRNMILYGSDAGRMQNYTDDISDYLRVKENSRLNINDLYGYIEKLPDGPAFLDGLGVAPPEDYSPTDRPWYRTALVADGGIAETPPYNDVVTGEVILTYSCCIYDDEGGHLGVVCIDVWIDYIGKKLLIRLLSKTVTDSWLLRT